MLNLTGWAWRFLRSALVCKNNIVLVGLSGYAHRQVSIIVMWVRPAAGFDAVPGASL